MEFKFARAMIGLGIPGASLAVFYLLFNNLKFSFSQISAEYTALIAVLFVVVVGFLTFYALRLWAPRNSVTKETNLTPTDKVIEKAFTIEASGEIVTFDVLMRSIAHDIIKINAHTHPLGISAEYEWIDKYYPGSQILMQSLSSLSMLTNDKNKSDNKITFDIIKIKLSDGTTKELYFDISSFFGDFISSSLEPNAFITKKLRDIYQKNAS